MAFEISAKVLADASGFDATMRHIQGTASEVGSHIVSHVGGALAGIFSVGAIENQVEKVIEYADKIKNLSVRTGINVEDLQKLDYAATLTNSSLDEVTKAVERFGIAQAKARAEGAGGEHFEAFKRMGLSKEQINNTEDFVHNFYQVGEHIRNAAVDGQLLADLTATMGKHARELVPAFKEGLTDMAAEAEKVGAVIPTDSVLAMAEASDRIKTLWIQIRAIMAEDVAMPILTNWEKASFWLEKMVLWGQTRREGFASGKTPEEIAEMLKSARAEVDAEEKGSNEARDARMEAAKKGRLQDVPESKEEEKAVRARKETEEKLDKAQVAEAAKMLSIRERIAESKRKEAMEGKSEQEKERQATEEIASMKKRMEFERDVGGATDLELLQMQEDISKRELELKKMKSRPDQDKYITDSLARVGGYSSSAQSKMESLAERTALATEEIAKNTKVELAGEEYAL